MPEGDTIHRIARRIDAALVGRRIDRAEAPNPRSPLHRRAGELGERVLDRAEARGKHLLLHFEGERVIHSHLGMGGRWFVAADGRLPRGRPWLLFASGRSVAVCAGGRILRLLSASRVRNDPTLIQLGPDPLASDFDQRAAVARLQAWEPSETVGTALLDQRLLAGIGNAIRIEALWLAGVSPWRRVGDLSEADAAALVESSCWVMETAIHNGRRPRRIYGFPPARRCPRCEGRIRTWGQGDDARITYWCEACQR